MTGRYEFGGIERMKPRRRFAQKSTEMKRYEAAGLSQEELACCRQNQRISSLDSALRRLLNYCVGNGSNRQGNPYGKDEVVDALKVLAEIDGIQDYLDVKLT